MRPLLKVAALTSLIIWLAMSCFSQDKVPHNLSLRIGAGNNVSMQNFFSNETSLNIPGSAFVNVGLATNLLERNNRSLFAGLEMQALNYYPSINEKANLGFVSLLLGKSKRFDISQQFYFKQTNGLSLNSLIEVTSSKIINSTYSGHPFKNLNVGWFSNLQVLFAGEKRKIRNIDYGLGIEFAFKGFQLFKDESYPAYLIQDYFIQYGLSLNVNYNF